MIDTEIKNIALRFETAPSNFSPGHIDTGTLAMLSVTDFLPADKDAVPKILDLGCGYGVVGIVAGKLAGPEHIIMCDISECAVKQARINAALNQMPNMDIRISNGFQNVPENDFTLILSNPPYHADFSVAKHFIENGLKKLAVGGKFIMVTKRHDWYKNKLISVFGGVKIHKINGYYVFIAEKRVTPTKRKVKNPNIPSRKLQRKHKTRKASH